LIGKAFKADSGVNKILLHGKKAREKVFDGLGERKRRQTAFEG